MNAILKAFPQALGKAGKELATTHRDKIARVVDCATASDSELRDPKKFEEWLGVSTKAKKLSVSAKVPSENEVLKRLKINVTIIDYQKIGKSVDKANKFLEKAKKWEPGKNIEDRLDFAYVFYNQFKKDRKAKKDKMTLEKNAVWTAEEMISIAADLGSAKAHVLAWERNAPKLARAYAGYYKIFDDAEKALRKVQELMDGHLELSSIRATIMAHWQAVMELRGKLGDARDNARALGTKISRVKPKIDIALQEANDVMADVAPYATPALVSKAKKALNTMIKPYSDVLDKMFGIK